MIVKCKCKIGHLYQNCWPFLPELEAQKGMARLLGLNLTLISFSWYKTLGTMLKVVWKEFDA